MTNHVHLALEAGPTPLSRIILALHGSYSQAFNRRHRRVGHLFQGRFHAFLIEKEAYFAEVLRYVVLNPVRAKMVDRPEDYRWSSYRATSGLEEASLILGMDAFEIMCCWPSSYRVLPFFPQL